MNGYIEQKDEHLAAVETSQQRPVKIIDFATDPLYQGSDPHKSQPRTPSPRDLSQEMTESLNDE